MKFIYLLLIISFFLQCASSNDKDVICDLIVKINQTEICIPKIKGLTNICNDEKHTSFVDDYTYKGEEVLSFYVDETSLKSSVLEPNEVITLFVNSKLKEDMTRNKFNHFLDLTATLYTNMKYLDDLFKEIALSLDQLAVDKPVLVSSYALSENAQTYVLLCKLKLKNYEYYVLSSTNLLFVKQKLIMSNYIINYTNINSIDKLKQKNDFFILRFLSENS